jgi:transposase
MAEHDTTIAVLEKLIIALRAENEILKAEIVALRADNRELQHKLNANSSNSSKPPSSDGLHKKPAPQSLRESSGKKSGGQVGHKGQTLMMTETPDVVVEHKAPAQCTGCGVDISSVTTGATERRQVFDLPEPKAVVTEHRALVVCCPSCGVRNRSFPDDVRAPVQFGTRLKASVVYLSVQQLLPEDRLSAVCADLFGLPVSTATLATINREAAEKLAPFQETTLETLKAAPVKHLDETGIRIGGKTQWLHVISNATHTHYRACAKRGNLLEGVCGTVVHDHWKPYFTMTGVMHALCNAHILREIKALIEIEKEPWAKAMQRLLRLGCRFQKLPDALWIDRFKHLYQRIIAQGLAFHDQQPAFAAQPKRGKKKRRTGHNLLIRLRDFQDDVLRFLADNTVPFTNNQAEQDIRMTKVKLKISGGFRTQQGADDFCTIRGFISSKRKQNLSPYHALALALA